MTGRRRRSARFGPRWWDRNGHVSFYRPETGWVTYSSDGGEAFEWPRPCRGATPSHQSGTQVADNDAEDAASHMSAVSG